MEINEATEKALDFLANAVEDEAEHSGYRLEAAREILKYSASMRP